ncbi:hypothetical protein KPSA1_05115 [Pseudomonas syringae pv. actinidiae]|uniref:Uncharacterized protein n=1 Tax=Pseudomonas syringae pv. actinidiae TaxID=103796 RepID=A0A2V0QQY5_PSESF|nr:hypothetical protein KPSA1_05115 [Pseudomonas syringae pv. actinidiae]
MKIKKVATKLARPKVTLHRLLPLFAVHIAIYRTNVTFSQRNSAFSPP